MYHDRCILVDEYQLGSHETLIISEIIGTFTFEYHWND